MTDLPDDAPQPYNPGHQIEGLDRCHTVLMMLDQLLLDHPAVVKSEVSHLVEEAFGAIYQAYQKIGELGAKGSI